MAERSGGEQPGSEQSGRGEVLLIERDEGVVTLTLNRPKALNALNSDIIGALEAAVGDLQQDRDLRCVIVTGAGSKSFVAGADISEMSTFGAVDAQRFASRGQRVLAGLEALPVPVIAAVNGFALGGGCELALACDLIYAAENARFGQPEVDLGVIPGFGGTQRLGRKISRMRAAELIYTGRHVKAPEAKAIGLCLDVFPADELMDRVREVAGNIARKGPLAVRAAKRVMRAGADAPLAVGTATEQESFAVLFGSADQKEGMHAFLEKRAANFTAS
jgi:enoyl-CoA hydratase